MQVRSLVLVTVLLGLTVPLTAQISGRCTWSISSSGMLSLSCTPDQPPPPTPPTISSFTADSTTILQGQSTVLRWVLAGGTATSQSIAPGIGGIPIATRSRQVTLSVTTEYVLTVQPGTVMARRTITVLPPPPTGEPIFGVVDPAILGECSAATHDTHVLSGGDGFRYRTWHPQQDPTGCWYAHEHGDNPAVGYAALSAEIDRQVGLGRIPNAYAPTLKAAAAAPLLFGYVGRRMPMPGEPNGHDEAHEGFKVFIARRGELNDFEQFTSRIVALHVNHTGSGGPARFTQPLHSLETRQIHEQGPYAFVKGLFQTGGTDNVCDQRHGSPVKDVMSLQNRCKILSPYEIWLMEFVVRGPGGPVYEAFATPAVFDPITVLDVLNPTAVVYAWDPRMALVKAFGDDWSNFHGCNRETYAQMGNWANAGGQNEYWTDPLGNPVVPGAANGVHQYLSTIDAVGAVSYGGSTLVAGGAGPVAFKLAVDYCTNLAKLGLKN